MLQMPVKPKAPKIGKQMLEIADIRVEGIPQPRGKIKESVARQYGAAMSKKGVMSFEAIVVFYDGGNLWLGDGRHRIFGARLFGLAHIHADVREGTQRDAILYALGSANSQHGIRYTNADKRRAVLFMLMDDDWVTWSDSRIAEHCQVDPKTVWNIRHDAGREIPSLRQGKDGKRYHLPRRRCKVCGTLEDGIRHDHFRCEQCGKVSAEAVGYHLVDGRWLCKNCVAASAPAAQQSQAPGRKGKRVGNNPNQMPLPGIESFAASGAAREGRP